MAWNADENEGVSMDLAYKMMRHQTPASQRRALAWITARLAEDQRGREAKAHDGVKPSTWFTDPQGEGFLDRGEAIQEADAEPWGIVELCGSAVVLQQFVVIVPISDDGGISYEDKAFPTRDEAEKYVAAMRADEPTDAPASTSERNADV